MADPDDQADRTDGSEEAPSGLLARRTEQRRLNAIREALVSVVGEEDAAHLWDHYLIETGDWNAEVPTEEEVLAGKLDVARAGRLRSRGLWVHGPRHGDAKWLEPTEPT